MSLTTYDLPVVFACAVELAQVTIDYRPEDHQGIPAEPSEDFTDVGLDAILEWHRALDGIVQTSTRLKRALGATGPLDAGDQLHDKAEPTWENFQNQFKYAAHPPKVRQALWKLANGAIDLSGYAAVRVPDAKLRERGLRLLGQGLAQLWVGLTHDQRETVKPLLAQTSPALGWPPSTDCDPPPYDGPEELAESDCFRVVDFGGGFATRSTDFFEQKAAALAKAFPPEPAPSSAVSPQPPSSPKEIIAPMPFQLTHIFEQAVRYGVVIWDKKSQVITDRDPFDCVPDFGEIGVTREHMAKAMQIPAFNKEQWKKAVKRAKLSELARKALVRLNEAEEWEHLPRDHNGTRQPGSLGTAFGLLKQGLRELYLAMSPKNQKTVKGLLPLIRERWEKDFPTSNGAKGQEETKKKPIPRAEANVMVREYLKKAPGATIKKIKEATEVSTGAISQSAAWKAHQAAKMIRKGQPGRQAKTIQLTDKMLKALGQLDDPGASMTAEEAAWRKLLENASPDERGRLNRLNSTERAERIQALLEQVTDQIDSERKPHRS